VLFYSYTYQWFGPSTPGSRRRRALLNGAVFGGLAVVVMTARIEIFEGVHVDARSVPIALIALFEGWLTGSLAATLPAAYHLWLGGSGAWAGVVALGAAAGAGGLAHVWARRDGGVGPRHALTLSVAVFVTTCASFALLGAQGLARVGQVWPPLLVVLIVGIGAAARLFHDVVERAEAVTAYARFRSIIDEASDAIRIVDPDSLKILDVNRRDCEISGYPRETLIGRDVRSLWPDAPELRAQREAEIAEARTHGFTRAFGTPFRRASGEIIRVDSTRRIVSHHGRRYEIVIYREASEREAAEAARREAADLRAVALLASAAAHEINNPLTVVVGSLELLSRHHGPDQQERRWLERAHAAAQRIRDIVARMTRITRIERTDARPGVPPMLDIQKSSDAE
jgi:PAS domain S-box-containing protein